MENQPQDRLMKLEGVVEHMIYENTETGYAVFEVDAGGTDVIVAGNVGSVDNGMSVTVYGRMVNHPSYGEQFKAETCEASLPQDTTALLSYLSSGVLPYIGPSTAKKIVSMFGEDTLNVISETPQSLCRIKGITPEKAAAISNEFRRMYGVREVVAWFTKYGLSAQQAVTAYRAFGPHTVEALTQNPYLLCGDPLQLKFAQVDGIAAALQFDSGSRLRVAAGLLYALRHNANNGHTCLPRAKLLDSTAKFLRVEPASIEAGLDELLSTEDLRTRTYQNIGYIYLPDLLSAEEDIAARLGQLSTFPTEPPKTLETDIRVLEMTQGFEYAPLQKEAIRLALSSRVMVLTGGPGTGKTTLGEFFISFVMGHYPNTPNLMSSHSGFMTRMFYDAVLNIITSNEYCWSDVFPDIVFEGNNAKEETINLGRWQPFKTLTCRPIRGSLTGVTRCEGFLYVDDLVSGIEEALSIDRLDKLYGEYTTDLKSRKKKKAKEIHIATRWSVHDVIGRLERMYEGNPRAEFIAVPDIDPQTGKSNFDYDYDVGFDEKYFHDMEMSMDDVSYRCLYKSDPIEREGILYHPTELQRYIGGLPDREPDSILEFCDTKDTGTDYNFLGVFYQYGDRYYLEDLVFKNIDPGTLDELNSDMLVKHHVQQAQFESNKEGSRTANEVERLVKAKGGRCHITKKYTTQNKETKIIVNSSWVKEHVIFKDITEYEPKSDYGVMMSFLCSYTQLGKNKHDDAPDTLAMFAQFVDALLGGEGQVVKRSDLGI